jgi:hypothetical protein
MRAEEEMKPWLQIQALLDEIRTAASAFDVDRLRRLVMGVAHAPKRSKPFIPFRKRSALKAVKDVATDVPGSVEQSARKNVH